MENNDVSVFQEIINLLDAIIWPVVILVVLVIFNKQIPEFFRRIGGKVKKISIANLFELELSHVEAADLKWSSEYTPDIRQPTSATEFMSYAPSLIQELQSESKGDYAIIDLGVGKSWLTSRLFIIATLLKQTKGLENYVFIETSGGVQNRFIGMVNADAIRWTFALHYPGLEESYRMAYLEREMNDPSSQKHGIITVEQAGNMVTTFLQSIQLEGNPSEEEMNEWVPITDQGFYEHCRWITSNLLFDVLGDELKTNCITDTLDYKPEEKFVSIVMQEEKYIAVTDSKGEFKYLIDREVLITEIARKVIVQ